MRDFGNVPGERKAGQFRNEFLVYLAAAELRRLGRNENRLERFRRVRFKKLVELLTDGACLDIAHDDKREIIRDVASLVIPHDVVAGKLVKDVDEPNDRQPVRVTLKRRGEK